MPVTFGGLLLWNIVALAAFFCGSEAVTKFCLVTSDTGTNRISELNTLKNTEKAACTAAVDKCMECYSNPTASGTKSILYHSKCGKTALAPDVWTCADVNACADNKVTTACYPNLAILLDANNGADPKKKHCKHAVKDYKTITNDVTVVDQMICKNTDDCATGIGYETDGKPAIAFMGCKEECIIKMKDKKQSDRKADATCTPCDSAKCVLPTPAPATTKTNPAGGDVTTATKPDSNTTKPAGGGPKPTTSDSSSIPRANLVAAFAAAATVSVAVGMFRAVN